MDAVVAKKGMVSIEASAMMFSVRLYDADNPTDYVSSFQVFKYGDTGLAYAITGPGFYRLLPSLLPKVFKDLDLVSLEGYVTKAHRRAMAYLLRDVATVSVVRAGHCAGRDMVWVRVTLL